MSAIDSFLREVECYDSKWFVEIGGPAARTEVNELRHAIKSQQDLDPTLENIGISRIEELWENGAAEEAKHAE